MLHGPRHAELDLQLHLFTVHPRYRPAAEGGDGVGGDGVLAGAHGGGSDVLAVLVVPDAHLDEQQLHSLL